MIPTISIVTPSYNQAPFLEATIQSIIGQNYPHLEYIIMDGGSTDNSVAIIQQYANQLAYWVSQPDGGQYAAINAGLQYSSGEIMAWLNADDMYTPYALYTVATLFNRFPHIEWLTTLRLVAWSAEGQQKRVTRMNGYSRAGFYRGENLPGRPWNAIACIQQESTFWRRSLWKRAGGYVDSSLRLAGDFELWARFFQQADLYGIVAPIGGFREHGDQKSVHHQTEYVAEAHQVLQQMGHRPAKTWQKFPRLMMARFAPPSLRKRLGRWGLLYPSYCCQLLNDAWTIDVVYC